MGDIAGEQERAAGSKGIQEPQGLQALGNPADDSFAGAFEAALDKRREGLENQIADAERDQRLARIAAKLGKEPEELAAEVERLMALSEDDLLGMVITDPVGSMAKEEANGRLMI